MENGDMTTDLLDIRAIEQSLVTLNYRLTSRALNLWQGNESHPSGRGVYDDLDDHLKPSTIARVRKAQIPKKETERVFHGLLGHYLQYCLFPYENELFTWMKGAAAHVDGEKIYFKDILSWCQKRSDLEKRRMLEKETTSLCKFLKPFALSFWEYLLELLKDEFAYPGYAAYCKDKKHVDYDAYVPKLHTILEQTEALHFEAMEHWTQRSLGLPLSELNRFDGVYLLGLGEFDHLFPREIPLEDHLDFFDQWGMRVKDMRGTHLHIDHSPDKGAQAMSFALRIPDEIHLVMNPQGGWIDLETLFHEMGHTLSHALTSPELSFAEKDFFTSNTLSETHAFLLQNMCFSPVFLERALSLSPAAIEEITFFKALKDLSVFRRYVSKFLAEYEMFDNNDIGDGNAYARLLKKYTGFSYRPETQLFDLAPEFYALDYVISWIAEATMQKWLVGTLGDDWMFKPEAGKIMKDWWQCGNRYELDEFFAVKGIGAIDTEDIVNGWRRNIGGQNSRAG
jgi:hypothetical protein